MSKKFSIQFVCLIGAISLTSCTIATNTVTNPTLPTCNVVLIGWDGAQRERVKEYLERGELPVLKALAAQGSFRNIDIRGTTDSTAGWAQILTGYDPEVTGAWSNYKFEPIPKGLSVFERLKEQFGQNIATLAVIAKEQTIGKVRHPFKIRLGESTTNTVASTAPHQTQVNQERIEPSDIHGSRVVVENGVRYRVYPGSPWLNMKDATDHWVYGLGKNENVAAKTIELIEQYKHKRFFVFVHFTEPDLAGHTFGENSPQYTAALVSNDTCTGRIIEKIKQLGLYDKTYIYVTTDHGFDEGKKTHRRATRGFLVTNDPRVRRDGDRADIAPTILNRFGLDLRRFTPPFASAALNKAQKNSSADQLTTGSRL